VCVARASSAAGAANAFAAALSGVEQQNLELSLAPAPRAALASSASSAAVAAAAAAAAAAEASAGAPDASAASASSSSLSSSASSDAVAADDEITVVFNVSRRRAATGAVAGLVLVGQDVSEHRRLAARCARVTHDMSLLVDHAAAPVFGTDAAGRVNEWNGAMARATGVEGGEVRGAALVGHVFGARGRLKLNEEEHRVALEVALQTALRGTSCGPLALTCALRDGRALELVLNIDPRRDGGDDSDAVRGTFCFAQDVGLRKALEHATAVRAAAEAAAEAKNRQLAVLCHEIRNPLNGILGTVAALDDEVTDPAIAELITTTLTCSNQLRRTIDQMLDMSKIEEGKLTLELEPFSVRRAVNAVVAQIQRAASEKGLTVVADLRGVSYPAPGCFVGDSCRVQQILAKCVFACARARCACDARAVVPFALTCTRSPLSSHIQLLLEQHQVHQRGQHHHPRGRRGVRRARLAAARLLPRGRHRMRHGRGRASQALPTVRNGAPFPHRQVRRQWPWAQHLSGACEAAWWDHPLYFVAGHGHNVCAAAADGGCCGAGGAAWGRGGAGDGAAGAGAAGAAAAGVAAAAAAAAGGQNGGVGGAAE
jgi:signal transduction histidine kinase